MPDVEFTNLFAVLLVALAAALALGFVPRLRVPAVVLEIALGVVVGPSVLGYLLTLGIGLFAGTGRREDVREPAFAAPTPPGEPTTRTDRAVAR